jgi:hypothetical protein
MAASEIGGVIAGNGRSNRGSLSWKSGSIESKVWRGIVVSGRVVCDTIGTRRRGKVGGPAHVSLSNGDRERF